MTNIKKLSRRKSNIHCVVILTFFVIVLTFTACDKNDDNLTLEKYPLLKVENQLKDYWRPIIGVSLVGYKFGNLNIEPKGDSQTFILDKGMSGGYGNIYVSVSYIRYSGVWSSASIKVDFTKGDTTTIVLTGCSGAEGCSGIFLESKRISTPSVSL
jgi:hypothetical protein